MRYLFTLKTVKQCTEYRILYLSYCALASLFLILFQNCQRKHLNMKEKAILEDNMLKY